MSDDLEAVAADGDVVYIVGSEVNAVRASDGARLWRFLGPAGEALTASGEVQIGTSSDGALEVFAPYEYDLKLDRQTGRQLEFGPSGGRDHPRGFTPFAASPIHAFEIRYRDGAAREAMAVRADGSEAFVFSVDRPQFNEPDPLQVGAVIVVPLSSGDVVALRFAPTSK